jgi:type IV pilus assembly protein PilY1
MRLRAIAAVAPAARPAKRAACALAVLIWAAAAAAQTCAPDTTVPHAPTTVFYGHVGGIAQATTIAPASDGSVRALDAKTGALLWTFTPTEVSASAAKTGLLTDARVLRFDVNGDGTIDASAGDKVWLYFGLRRAGATYYALDITDRTKPHILWRLDAVSLDGLSDAWSTPTIARVRVAGAKQNGEHFVLIFGGGYSANAPAAGNAIFMVDAATGDVLWRAEGIASPIPAGVTVLDTDGDGFADRMYAVDLNGSLWRFDIWNGRPGESLVTSGVIADLLDPTLQASAAPKFFNAPDVALIQPRGGAPYYSVSVGSGDPTSVAGTVSRDHFYSIRDREPFDARSQASYDAVVPILSSDLVNISATLDSTRLPFDAPGWMIEVSTVGEKVVADSVTVNGVVMFATFQPSGTSDSCEVTGSTRVYAVRVDTATVGVDLNGDGKITSADVAIALPTVGPPAAVSIRLGVPAPASGSPSDGAIGGSADAPTSLTPVCIVGSETLKTCVTANALVRTYWQRPGVK